MAQPSGVYETGGSPTGNVFDVGGELTFEKLYHGFDQMEWSLDDDDELVEKDVIMHPDDVGKWPDLTPEQTEAVEALKRRKHEELLARRRRRRLS